jgi:hypothetical protein
MVGRVHVQLPQLRLLRRYAPRNDMRVVGTCNSGPTESRRAKKNAKQSQSALGGIRAKSFTGKGL